MGKIAIVPVNHKPGIINQALLKLTVDPKKVLPEYLKLALESEPIQDQYFRNQSGGVIQNVASVKVLSQIDVPLPAIDVQRAIVNQVTEEQELVAGTKS